MHCQVCPAPAPYYIDPHCSRCKRKESGQLQTQREHYNELCMIIVNSTNEETPDSNMLPCKALVPLERRRLVWIFGWHSPIQVGKSWNYMQWYLDLRWTTCMKNNPVKRARGYSKLRAGSEIKETKRRVRRLQIKDRILHTNSIFNLSFEQASQIVLIIASAG